MSLSRRGWQVEAFRWSGAIDPRTGESRLWRPQKGQRNKELYDSAPASLRRLVQGLFWTLIPMEEFGVADEDGAICISVRGQYSKGKWRDDCDEFQIRAIGSWLRDQGCRISRPPSGFYDVDALMKYLLAYEDLDDL